MSEHVHSDEKSDIASLFRVLSTGLILKLVRGHSAVKQFYLPDLREALTGNEKGENPKDANLAYDASGS